MRLKSKTLFKGSRLLELSEVSRVFLVELINRRLLLQRAKVYSPKRRKLTLFSSRRMRALTSHGEMHLEVATTSMLSLVAWELIIPLAKRNSSLSRNSLILSWTWWTTQAWRLVRDSKKKNMWSSSVEGTSLSSKRSLDSSPLTSSGGNWVHLTLPSPRYCLESKTLSHLPSLPWPGLTPVTSQESQKPDRKTQCFSS